MAIVALLYVCNCGSFAYFSEVVEAASFAVVVAKDDCRTGVFTVLEFKSRKPRCSNVEDDRFLSGIAVLESDADRLDSENAWVEPSDNARTTREDTLLVILLLVCEFTVNCSCSLLGSMACRCEVMFGAAVLNFLCLPKLTCCLVCSCRFQSRKRRW